MWHVLYLFNGNEHDSMPSTEKSRPIPRMSLNLTNEEREPLIRQIRKHVDGHRWPFSRDLWPLKATLAKLDPPNPKAESFPSLRTCAPPRSRQSRARRCNPLSPRVDIPALHPRGCRG